jgi:hypothetical protein
MKIEGIGFHLDEQSGYRSFAVYGVRDSDGMPCMIILAEAPYRDPTIASGLRALRGPQFKFIQELRDVRRLFAAVGIPDSRYTLEAGPDPNGAPDLVATLADRSLAVEATHLHLPAPPGESHQSGVAVASAFENLVNRLIEHSATLKSRLRAHRGYRVFVFFGGADGRALEMPPKVRGKINLDQLVAFLKATNPPPIFSEREREAPDEHISEAIQYNDDQSIGLTWQRLTGPPSPPSSVWRALGFDLGLGRAREIMQQEVTDEVRRLVKQHDKADIDLLVITTGAPTRDGWKYPSDGVCSYLLKSATDPLSGYTPQRIKNVVLHDLMFDRTVRWLFGDSGVLA